MNNQDIQSRHQEIAEKAEDIAAVERLVALKNQQDTNRQTLRHRGYNDNEIDVMECYQRSCEYHVRCASAICQRVWIADDGTLRFAGRAADEFVGRLRRFNCVPVGQQRSLAAVVYLRLIGGRS